MDVADVELAKRILSEVNYYRLSGYALQFRDKANPDDYVPGTKFENVFRLHQFDDELRHILKPHLDTIELYARTHVAYGFSTTKCQNPPHDQHYESDNFYNKDSHNNIITLSLDREMKNSKDSLFVIHHAAKYSGRMPLWVIVELLSFTNLSKLYSAMYNSEKNIIAANMGTTREILKNHLQCLANLRNKVAHAGRLYNVVYNPPAKLGYAFLKQNKLVKANTLFAYLLALMRRLPSTSDRQLLATDIMNLLTQYANCVELSLIGFPSDYTKCLNNEIV